MINNPRFFSNVLLAAIMGISFSIFPTNVLLALVIMVLTAITCTLTNSINFIFLWILAYYLIAFIIIFLIILHIIKKNGYLSNKYFRVSK